MKKCIIALALVASVSCGDDPFSPEDAFGVYDLVTIGGEPLPQTAAEDTLFSATLTIGPGSATGGSVVRSLTMKRDSQPTRVRTYDGQYFTAGDGDLRLEAGWLSTITSRGDRITETGDLPFPGDWVYDRRNAQQN